MAEDLLTAEDLTQRHVKEELPKTFDVVVLGTGLPECIVAAACSRLGFSVLHLDRNDYYGDLWASFNLRTIQQWAVRDKRNDVGTRINPESLLRDGEQYVTAGCQSFVENIDQQFCHKQASGQEFNNDAASNIEGIDSEWRKFSLDLLPKVLLARGDMVKLLVDSGVAKYCEFKCVDRFLSCSVKEDSVTFESVPFSRSKIFQNDTIPVQDKLQAKRLIQKCIEWQKNPINNEEWEDFADQPFDAYLEVLGISDHVKSLFTDTLTILHPASSTEESLEAIRQFMESMGRFGDSPFLWTLYGSGELPQCFARLCAVFGGIYCLDRQVDGFIIAEKRIVAVVTEGQRINCSHVFANHAYLPHQFLELSVKKRLNRAVLITDQSLLPDPEKDHISVLNLASLDVTILPYLLEVGYEGSAAPKGKYVVHITAQSGNDARTTLEPIVDLFFGNARSEEGKPKLLWQLYFDLTVPSVVSNSLPTNMGIVPSVDEQLNYTEIISLTKRIFKKSLPECDFLPPSLAEEDEEVREENSENLVGPHSMGNNGVSEQDGLTKDFNT